MKLGSVTTIGNPEPQPPLNHTSSVPSTWYRSNTALMYVAGTHEQMTAMSRPQTVRITNILQNLNSSCTRVQGRPTLVRRAVSDSMVIKGGFYTWLVSEGLYRNPVHFLPRFISFRHIRTRQSRSYPHHNNRGGQMKL